MRVIETGTQSFHVWGGYRDFTGFRKDKGEGEAEDLPREDYG